MSDILKCVGGWGICDLVLSRSLVKKYTNTANGDPQAQKEKGIQLTATFQTVKKDRFLQSKKIASCSGGCKI